jgi:hypothetical protein
MDMQVINISTKQGTVNLVSMVSLAHKQPTPEVGMGATECWYSDRKACTITKVSPSGKTIETVRDVATRTDSTGPSDSQQYTYARGDGHATVWTLRSNGRYIRKGDSVRSGVQLLVGERDEFYDFTR